MMISLSRRKGAARMKAAMGRHRKPGQRDAAPALSSPLDRETWPRTQWVLADYLAVYVLDSGHELRRMPCIVCGDFLAGEPVSLVTLVSRDICADCGRHPHAITALCHERCKPADLGDVLDHILSKTGFTGTA